MSASDPAAAAAWVFLLLVLPVLPALTCHNRLTSCCQAGWAALQCCQHLTDAALRPLAHLRSSHRKHAHTALLEDVLPL